MTWDFSTDEGFQERLDWAESLVRDHIEDLDLRYPGLHYTPPTAEIAEVIEPLKAQVKAQGLWATHLGPELGGVGYGQVSLALLNEVLGRSDWAPTIFGTQAPDTGNAEILARYGTTEQKARYLRPLLAGEIFSCYSMTEPQGGSDPGLFRTQATKDGGDWLLDGWKFFSSNASTASFFVVLAVTAPELPSHDRMSMFLVPADAPGLKIVRDIGLGAEPLGHGHHGLVWYDRVRLPPDALLGEVGDGFAVAQTRLGGGRVHHAMRAVGVCNRVFEMMTERAVSRRSKGTLLAEKGAVEGFIADSWIQVQSFRLLVLHAAWTVDQVGMAGARKEVAAIKIAAPQVMHDVVTRAIQLHGAIGISNELPLWRFLQQVFVVGFSDGPAEVHRRSLTRALLKTARPAEGVWPSEHIPTRLGTVPDDVRHSLERHVANL